MIPKKLTKDDILLAAEAAAAWPMGNVTTWTVDRKEGSKLEEEDGRIGYG